MAMTSCPKRFHEAATRYEINCDFYGKKGGDKHYNCNNDEERLGMSINECADLCLRMRPKNGNNAQQSNGNEDGQDSYSGPECVSFSYNPSTKLCRLSDRSQPTTKTGSGSDYLCIFGSRVASLKQVYENIVPLVIVLVLGFVTYLFLLCYYSNKKPLVRESNKVQPTPVQPQRFVVQQQQQQQQYYQRQVVVQQDQRQVVVQQVVQAYSSPQYQQTTKMGYWVGPDGLPLNSKKKR